MYIPMGGRSTRMGNIWLIFLFVALWHDMEMKLIAWGLLNAFFYTLEVSGSYFMNSEFVQKNLSSNAITYIGLFSGATYIIILVMVNLLGYSMMGTDGTSLVFSKLLSYEGFRVVVISYYFLVNGVNLMSYITELRSTKNNTEKID